MAAHALVSGYLVLLGPFGCCEPGYSGSILEDSGLEVGLLVA